MIVMLGALLFLLHVFSISDYLLPLLQQSPVHSRLPNWCFSPDLSPDFPIRNSTCPLTNLFSFPKTFFSNMSHLVKAMAFLNGSSYKHWITFWFFHNHLTYFTNSSSKGFPNCLLFFMPAALEESQSSASLPWSSNCFQGLQYFHL